jgi:hypothetical protein
VAVPVRISVTVNAVRARRELTGIVGAVRSLGRLRTPRLSVDTSSIRGAVKDYTSLGKEARRSLANLDETLDEVKRSGYLAFDGATKKLGDYEATAHRTVGRLKAVAVATAAVSVAGQAIRGAAGYLKNAVVAASSLNETTSKSKVIFGENAASIIAFSQTADRNLGLSQQAALDAASSFGDLFQQVGIGGPKAAALSKSTLQLASDLSSFSDMDVPDVLERISAAYRGEYDSVQKLVPAITAARVETEALALSGKKTAKELTAQDRALAVNAILMKDSARAQGDFARTSDSLANVTRANKSGLANLSATIGTALLPGVTALAIAFRDKVLPALNTLVADYAPKVNAFFTDLAKNGFNASADLGQAFAGLKSIGASLTQLSAAGGSGLADTLTVTGIAMSVLADHADLLARAMPFVIAGFVAYKAAILAANVAQLANLPLKVAEVVVNRQLVRSNQALIASRAGVTTATITGTTAETAATATKSRGIVVTAAQRVAMLASAAATGIATAATNAFGLATKIAMIGPLGLVVAAIAAVIAIGYLVIKNWDTIKRVALKVFGAVSRAIGSVVTWVRENWKKLVPLLLGPIGIAVGLIVKHKDRILDIFRKVKTGVVSIFKGIGGVISSAIKGAVNLVIDLVNKPIRGVNAIAGRIPGVPEIPEIPKLASGGIVRARPGGVLAILGEGGYDEAVVPLRGKGFGNVTVNLTAYITSNDPDEVYRQLAKKLRRDGPGLLRAS